MNSSRSLPEKIRFGVIGLEHPHVDVMTAGLIDAGAIPVWVQDADPAKVLAFRGRFPQITEAPTEDWILADDSLQLVVSAAIPDQRGPLSTRVMRSGKDFLSAKPAFTTLSQLDEARTVAGTTGRKFFIFYSERVDVRSALMAGEIVASGRLGEIVQVHCLAPHRLNRSSRPAWFFDPARSGGILGDIGSHQFEQILHYGNIRKAAITHAYTTNRSVPEHPSFEDFGEAAMIGENGVTGYVRVDWLTPDGLGVWGDVRTTILGTKGTLEIRKYTDVARERSPDHLYLVDEKGEHHLRPDPGTPRPYFRDLLTDCVERSETAMTQEHAFLAMELSLKAQAMAMAIDQEKRK